MKKSLLLAALLLPCVAQAETWVCTLPSSDDSSYLLRFSRNGNRFSFTNSSILYESGNPRIVYEGSLIPIIETETMLNLLDIKTDGTNLGIYMINKETNVLISDGVRYSVDTLRGEGHCVKI